MSKHTSERMDFCEGKYTIINNKGILTAMRNGEPWGRDLVGDNLVYWMLVEAVKLREQRDELLAALLTARDHIDMEALEISHRKDAERIRAAIAKETGEAA